MHSLKEDTDYAEIVEIIKNRVEFELTNESQNIILDKNVDITHELKSEEVAKSASKLSSQKEVRNLYLNCKETFIKALD